MDCSAADLKNAYSYWDNTADTLKKIEGYLKISWAPKLKDLDHKDTSRSTAVGIIKTLPGWMAENIFDGDPRSIYLNRSFKNPANTPFVNSQEIGSRTWRGTNKCSVRRSLVEEAEEVRNKGEDSLQIRRKRVIQHIATSSYPTAWADLPDIFPFIRIANNKEFHQVIERRR